MLESFIDFCQCSNIASATSKSNEVLKRNESANWQMIQCQLVEADGMYTYTMVFQRVKEVIIKKHQEISEKLDEKESN